VIGAVAVNMKQNISNVPEDVLQTHYLHAGNLYVAKEPCMITTVLGSCVGVCLWDPKKNLGGMNHFQLALWNGSGLASPKYGNIAVERLVDEIVSKGASITTLQAKVFGGGAVIHRHTDSLRIGENNISIALKMLEDYRIPVVASDVGGTQGRKIKFYTHTGTVYMKRIHSTVRKSGKSRA